MQKIMSCDKIYPGEGSMRLRNVKNKEEILSNSSYCIRDPFSYCGKWKEVFQNDHPIYIEIGMGKGQFILENAKMFPDINFIGIEKYDSVLAKAIMKVDDENLPNLRLVRGDAFEIEKMFHHEVSRIYLNFSDPWPKKRHHQRRLSSSIFLEKYDSIFVDDKVIEMRTDNVDLYQYSLVSFSEWGYILKEISFDFHKDGVPPITTEYEDKFSQKDCPIYYVMAEKIVLKRKTD